MRPQTARWIALLAVTGIVLYLCWLMLQPFVNVLLWAVVLAIVSYPVYLRLRGRGHSAHWSAVYTTGLVVLVVLIPMTLITVMVVLQAEAAYKGVESFLAPDSPLMKWAGKYVNLPALTDKEALAAQFKGFGATLAKGTLGFLGNVLGVIVQAFFVLFTLYYLLRDADRIVPAVRGVLPLTTEQGQAIFRRTGEIISASVEGVLLISAIQGFLGMLAFWVLGLPAAVLWGVVMFILCTIPMAGAAIVWAPAAIYLAATGHWGKAIALAAWGGLVIGTIDNVLRPKLVGQRTKLHELIIFFSVLGGLQVFGILGLFVGPVVAAIALALIEVFRQINDPADPAVAVQVILPRDPRPASAPAGETPTAPASGAPSPATSESPRAAIESVGTLDGQSPNDEPAIKP